MNHYKRDRKTKQESEFTAPAVAFSKASEIVSYCNLLPKRQLMALDRILFASNRYQDVYLRQSTIARRANLSREHVNRILLKFEQVGFISRNYRHMTSNMYKVAEIFNDLNLREKLKHLFPAFKWLPLALCLARGYTLNSRNITQDTISLTSNIYITNPKGNKYNYMHRSAKDFMEKMGDNPISESIRGLKELQLTKAGQIRLSAFPDEVIDWSADKLRYAKNVRDPYPFFFGLCRDYCNNNKILPNWDIPKVLMQKYNVAPDAAPSSAKPKSAQEWAKKKETKKTEVATRRLDAYKPWVKPEQKAEENPVEACHKVDDFYATEEGKRMVVLLGLKNPFKLEKEKYENTATMA